MKKLFFIVSFLFIFLLSNVFAGNLKTYKHAVNDYAINYPADWNIKELSGLEGFIVTPIKVGPNVAEEIYVAIDDISSNPLTLEVYVDLLVANWKEKDKKLELLEKSKTKLCGEDAYVLLLENGIFKYREYCFIHNSKAYNLKYSAKKEDFDKYFKESEAIIKSFKLSSQK